MLRKTSAKAHAGTVFMKCLVAFKAGGLVYWGKDTEEKGRNQVKERKNERAKERYAICEIFLIFGEGTTFG